MMNHVDIRDAFFDRIYEAGSKDPNIMVISADMDAFSLRKFAEDFPQRGDSVHEQKCLYRFRN